MASAADLWNTIPSLTTETVRFDPFNLFESWQISSQLKGQHSHISSSRAVLKTSAQQSTSYSTWHGPSMALYLIKNVPCTQTHSKVRTLALVYQTTGFGIVHNSKLGNCKQCPLLSNFASQVWLQCWTFLTVRQLPRRYRRTRTCCPRSDRSLQNDLEASISSSWPVKGQHS